MIDRYDEDGAKKHDATSRLAYHLWEQADRPDGQDQHFWASAEEKLAANGWRAPAMEDTAIGSDSRTSKDRPMDDNIDDLGRKPDGTTLAQPTLEDAPKKGSQVKKSGKLKDVEPGSDADSNDESLGV